MKTTYAQIVTLKLNTSNMCVAAGGKKIMFKMILMIDCDICGECFEQVALSCDRNPKAWQYMVADLKASAETSGWDLHRSHQCDACIFHNSQPLSAKAK